MDSLLLAAVYVELLGERQAALHLGSGSSAEHHMGMARAPALQRPVPLSPRPEREQPGHACPEDHRVISDLPHPVLPTPGRPRPDRTGASSAGLARRDMPPTLGGQRPGGFGGTAQSGAAAVGVST